MNYSKSQKKILAKMPKMTTEERAYQYKLCRDIINKNRLIGKLVKSKS